MTPQPIAAALTPAQRTRQHRAWYVYDWANSGYWTVTATVLIAPYLISIATRAACGDLAEGQTCRETLSVAGIPVAPGSLPGYTVALGTILAFFALPIVGALADRSPAPKRILGWLAGIGSTAASLMFFVAGTNWQFGVVLLIIANVCLALAQAVYDGILVQISLPDERDRVSSRGWALGYLAGFLLLAACMGLLTGADAGLFGLDTTMAVRLSMLGAGLWWGIFSIYPVVALWNRPVPAGRAATSISGTVRTSFGQLASTVKHLRGYRQTWMFLLAYLVFNDGIQTVITSSSTYASGELGFDSSQLVQVILLVQFVAFVGALVFGRLAVIIGSVRTIFCGLAGWLVVIVAAYLAPQGRFLIFVVIAIGIGLVMGGTQALARSVYSQLIPAGREAEYFSLYQAGERGTSWLGSLVFALMFQITGSYRPALISLMLFFLIGAILLSRVRVAEGIRAVGNVVPDKL
ncbi:MAG: MFS transporter [Actinomycetales bacterium]